MARNLVDPNAAVGCSRGFHVGSLNYADKHYHSGSGRIIIVEVDPKDAVSVPHESEHKLRTCKYKVISDYTGLLEQNKHILSTSTRDAIKRIIALKKAKKGKAFILAAITKKWPKVVTELKEIEKIKPRPKLLTKATIQLVKSVIE